MYVAICRKGKDGPIGEVAVLGRWGELRSRGSSKVFVGDGLV